jgi:MYXO-CTERM domain-containing protein
MRSKSLEAAPLVIALMSGAAGCGQVHSIPIDQDATDIAQTVCTSAYRCCTLAQLMNNSSAGTDVSMGTTDCTTNSTPCEQACETETAQNFRNQLSGVQDSVDKKRAVFEQAKVDACLQTIRSSTCDALNMTNHLTGVPGCDSFVTPLVAIGGGCSQDYECVNGWCNAGTCAAFVTVGQPCPSGGPSCAPGLTCDTNGTTNDASDDTCVEPGPTGATCSDALQCQSLSCSSSGGPGMTCQAPPSNPPPMCFYGGGCAAAGEGRPGPGTIMLLAVFVAFAFARTRRARNGSDRA